MHAQRMTTNKISLQYTLSDQKLIYFIYPLNCPYKHQSGKEKNNLKKPNNYTCI